MAESKAKKPRVQKTGRDLITDKAFEVVADRLDALEQRVNAIVEWASTLVNPDTPIGSFKEK